jgi:hypothetical protein
MTGRSDMRGLSAGAGRRPAQLRRCLDTRDRHNALPDDAEAQIITWITQQAGKSTSHKD